MPDEIAIEDLMYEIYIIDKIDTGRREIRATSERQLSNNILLP